MSWANRSNAPTTSPTPPTTAPTAPTTAAGTHTLNMWMREDGFRVDRLLMTTDAAFSPTGTGPPASLRSG